MSYPFSGINHHPLQIYIINNLQRKASRAARRWAEGATSTRRAAHFRPLGVAQEGLVLITCFQFNAATPKPVWFWHVSSLDGVQVAVEVATCNEDIYPGELPMGLSTLLSHFPAAHCRPGVEPPRTCSSSSPTWAPSNMTDQRAVKRAAIPVNRHGAQHVPVVRPPFTFGRILRLGFEFSPRARARPEAAVVDDEGVGLPGELFRPTRCRPPPRSSPRDPW